MNAKLDPTLLAELRELHHSEQAPAALERSVIERLLASHDKRPLGALLLTWWRRASIGRTVVGAALSMATVGAIYLGSRALSVEDNRVPGREPRVEAADGNHKSAHCPLQGLPPGVSYEPTRMDAEAVSAGLRLDTFDMPIPGCPPLARRMLIYVPRMALRGPIPVLIVLHDGGSSAEGVRALQAQNSFEAQAEVDGFIVVYANAAPSTGRSSSSGVWQTDAGMNPAVDDLAYLARVVERLGERLVAPGGPGLDVYLVGYGSGGQLALEAAAQHPDRYVGVAAILPDKVNHSRPPQRRGDTRLSRLLFVTLQEHHPEKAWPGAPLDVAVLNDWKAAVGLMQPQAKPGRPLEEQRPLGGVASAAATSRFAGRPLPAGTRLFTSSLPDERGRALAALVVQSKAAINVGPGGSPAPLDVATIARSFFFEGGVPGYPGAAGPL